MAKEEKIRSEIEDKYKWDLTPIYKTEDEWKKDYEEVKNEIEKVKDFKNTFLKDGKELYKFLVYDEGVSRKLEKLYYYAHLNYDSNTLDEKYKVMINDQSASLTENQIKLIGKYREYWEFKTAKFKPYNDSTNGIKAIGYANNGQINETATVERIGI